ncbi:hypothetical protein FJY84_02925 [Candidatus Bathyarchaeota archaeon]|nr:hypothetical protein [Candidatus Bathyarchaeota archaeon]
MSIKKGLVIFYSRTGTTKKLAEYIANNLDCDIEEIIDLKNRDGPIGWLMAGKDAGQKSLTNIKQPAKDPSKYNLVIIGTPIWNGTISTPIRTYIEQNKEKLRKTALFSTGLDRDLKSLEEISNSLKDKPVSMIKLHGKNDVNSNNYIDKISEFIQQCRNNL